MIDKDLKQHVENALDWDPSVDAKDIGVSADQGVVTLRGNVRSYSEKLGAERVALRVYGVKAVAHDLTVHVANAYQRTDTEIAPSGGVGSQVAFRRAGRPRHGDRQGRVDHVGGRPRLAVSEGRRGPRSSRAHGCERRHERY